MVLFGLYFRQETTSSSLPSSRKSEILDFAVGKKYRKLYSIIPEKWYIGSKIEKKKYQEYERGFASINNLEEYGEIKELIEKNREFLQIQFRTLEIGDHVFKFKGFWKLPHGLLNVSSWFEWLTGGSDEGWLQATMEKNIDVVLKVIGIIIAEKKGDLWSTKLEEIKLRSQVENGNDTMTWVFLLREWTKIYKEKPQKVIFLEGEDSIQDISEQPHINVRKITQPGGDFSERIVISLKCGNLVLFEDIGLCAALSSLIEVCFIFHVEYDKDGDSMCNFIQRTLGGFGSKEGAHNSRGKVKSTFINFQAEFGRIMLERNMGQLKMIM